MPKFNCNWCDYETDRKSSIISHINKLNKCSENIDTTKEENNYTKSNNKENNSKIKKEYICDKCNKKLYDKSTLNRHSKICKNISIEPINTTNNTTINNTTINNINNGVINNNTIINNINITILNPYNAPTISKLLRRQIERCIRDAFREEKANEIIPRVFDITYFNEKCPENHSIKYSNIKLDRSLVYNGYNFVPALLSSLKDEVIENLEELIDKVFREMNPEINDDKINKILDIR